LRWSVLTAEREVRGLVAVLLLLLLLLGICLQRIAAVCSERIGVVQGAICCKHTHGNSSTVRIPANLRG
jgi:hypothetical protein